MTTLFAGIDVGGTNVKLGLCDARGRIDSRVSIPAAVDKGPADCIRRIAQAFNALRRGRAVRAAGAGVPGPLDSDRRILIKAPNLARWERVPFPAMLSRALRVTAFMENDANCAAVGEYAAGAGSNARCMVLYTLGTGIGGGIVIDGKLWIGRNGGAGEVGHAVVDTHGPLCGCGQHGCVETFASATALVRRYCEISEREGLTARDVFNLARKGDRRARQAVDEAARMLGIGITSIIHILHPEVIVLSGGMAAGHGLLQKVRTEVRGRVFPFFLKGLRIVRGKLGDDAGWIGAAMVARDRVQ